MARPAALGRDKRRRAARDLLPRRGGLHRPRLPEKRDRRPCLAPAGRRVVRPAQNPQGRRKSHVPVGPVLHLDLALRRDGVLPRLGISARRRTAADRRMGRNRMDAGLGADAARSRIGSGLDRERLLRLGERLHGGWLVWRTHRQLGIHRADTQAAGRALRRRRMELRNPARILGFGPGTAGIGLLHLCLLLPRRRLQGGHRARRDLGRPGGELGRQRMVAGPSHHVGRLLSRGALELPRRLLRLRRSLRGGGHRRAP